MRHVLNVRNVLPLAATLICTLASGPARASHYAISDVPRLVTPAQADKLRKASVNTTEELLDKAAKSKDRKALAKTSKLAPTELLDLVRRCDLLRIKGVGSEMVLLFEAAGVKSTSELVKHEAPALMTQLTAANAKAKITEKPPTEPQLGDWIDQAKKLPQVVETK